MDSLVDASGKHSDGVAVISEGNGGKRMLNNEKITVDVDVLEELTEALSVLGMKINFNRNIENVYINQTTNNFYVNNDEDNAIASKEDEK